ncbi:MAG: hypothetical protein NZ455_12500 [Bacteroidia bacterium]|nr:hypothetical protein [Bacteroidia bacterium]MDW8345895.1 hypothetical protein [Bacteroidia bacterium]
MFDAYFQILTKLNLVWVVLVFLQSLSREAYGGRALARCGVPRTTLSNP